MCLFITVKDMVENYGTPSQLWGPPMWRVLYSTLYCAQQCIQFHKTGHKCRTPITQPPIQLRTMPVEQIEEAVRLIFYNIAFVLPCGVCREHTHEYFLGSKASVSDAVMQSVRLRNVDLSKPYDSIQKFRAAVTRRLDKQKCGTVCSSSSNRKSMEEASTIRLRAGLYFMSPFDIISTAFFLSTSCMRRVEAEQLHAYRTNHRCFERGLSTLVAFMGWMEPAKPVDNTGDFIHMFRSFKPANYEAWCKYTRGVVEKWMAQ